jgi:6-phosphogluconate dehydrogenase (decarboxylating)
MARLCEDSTGQRGSIMKAGFIGLGTMGASMAANLQKGIQKDGHTVIVHDVRRRPRHRTSKTARSGLTARRGGGRMRHDLYLAARAGPEFDAVVVRRERAFVHDPEGRGLFRSDDEFADHGAQGGDEYAKKGAHLFDAPVSGGPRGAATGKLAIWCGGDQDVFEKWQARAGSIGDQARYIGPIGAGSVAKLVHNCYGYIATAARPRCSAWA